jgi:hypothetical protein
MVQGLRVVFAPTTQLEDARRVPAAGAHGTVAAGRTPHGLRTYLDGPGGGLVFVRWDPDGLLCAVTLRDLKLEPDTDR